jgi:plasmid stabilization system protein ParE
MSEKKQLEFSLRSIANMETIRLRISIDNPIAANKVIESVASTADKLMDFPMLGHIGRRLGTRELVLSKYPYTIVYRLTMKKVIIAAVIHQSRKSPS